MCHEAFCENTFMLKYCIDRYKTQEMCDKAVDDFLPTLKFVTDWFHTNKIKLYSTLFGEEDIQFFKWRFC